MRTGERTLGAAAMLMAVCCAALPILAGALSGSLIATGGALAVLGGVLILGLYIVRRRRTRC